MGLSLFALAYGTFLPLAGDEAMLSQTTAVQMRMVFLKPDMTHAEVVKILRLENDFSRLTTNDNGRSHREYALDRNFSLYLHYRLDDNQESRFEHAILRHHDVVRGVAPLVRYAVPSIPGSGMMGAMSGGGPIGMGMGGRGMAGGVQMPGFGGGRSRAGSPGGRMGARRR